MKKMNNKGFSLVELIIVIAIMAILIAVLAPQYIKYVEKSRQSADLDNFQEIVNAINVAYADVDDAPSDGGSVAVNGSGDLSVSGASLSTALANVGCNVGNMKIKSKAYKKAITITASYGTDGLVTVTCSDAVLAASLGL